MHGQFIRVAAKETNLLKVALNYEQLQVGVKLGGAVATKPPGTLLFFMLTQKASLLLEGDNYSRLLTLCAVVYPLLSYLVLVPLFFFSRLFFDEESALLTCSLYLFLPNLILINLHLDQVLYPFLFISSLTLAVYAYQKDSILLAVLSGLVTYLAIYVSFSLLVLLPLIVMLLSAQMLKMKITQASLWRLGSTLMGIIAGCLMLEGIAYLFLNYNTLLRYRNAIAFHAAFKNWQPTAGETLTYALVNYVEYACWLGIPLVCFYLAGIKNSLVNLLSGEKNLIDLFSIALLIIFLMLGILGKTKGEVARLWLFLAPLICCFVVAELNSRFMINKERAFKALVLLQLATSLVIKRFQDFY